MLNIGKDCFCFIIQQNKLIFKRNCYYDSYCYYYYHFIIVVVVITIIIIIITTSTIANFNISLSKRFSIAITDITTVVVVFVVVVVVTTITIIEQTQQFLYTVPYLYIKPLFGALSFYDSC